MWKIQIQVKRYMVGVEKVWVQVGRYGRGGKVWIQVGRYGRGGKVWVQVGRYGRGGEGIVGVEKVW